MLKAGGSGSVGVRLPVMAPGTRSDLDGRLVGIGGWLRGGGGMLGRFPRGVCELDDAAFGCGNGRIEGAFDRAESCPSRIIAGRPSVIVPGVMLSGSGRPLSSFLVAIPFLDTGDGKVIVSLPPLLCRPCSSRDGLLMMDDSALDE